MQKESYITRYSLQYVLESVEAYNIIKHIYYILQLARQLLYL